MDRRYRFHPDDYALGENEKFYSDMEAKGWRLTKRGAYLSRFERCEPADARYRIEVTVPGFMEDTFLSDEQVMVYEDCGWEYVAHCGLLHIFRADAASDAPEFYNDPRQQAATLKKLRRNYLLAWLPLAVILGTRLSLTLAMQGDFGRVMREWGAQWQRGWITLTPIMLGIVTMVALGLFQMVRGAVHISLTYHRMKKGIPLNHAPRGKHPVYRLINRAGYAVLVVCAVLTVWQLKDYEKYDLPFEADGPYLMLSDLGIEGERGYLIYSDNTSEVEHVRSLLAEFWQTREVLDLPNGDYVWMDQQVFRLRREDMAEEFAGTLRELAIFIRDPENFRPVEVPGLDRAWVGGLEAVAIRGDLVIYVTCSSVIYEENGMEERVLPALAEIWT